MESSIWDLYLKNKSDLVNNNTPIPGITDNNMVVVDSDVKPRYVFKLFNAEWIKARQDIVELNTDFMINSNKHALQDNWNAFKQYISTMLTNNLLTKTVHGRKASYRARLTKS